MQTFTTEYKNTSDSSKDRPDTKILSHVNLQLSQKFHLPDRTPMILNLVARMKFLVAAGKRAAVNVEPCFICTMQRMSKNALNMKITVFTADRSQKHRIRGTQLSHRKFTIQLYRDWKGIKPVKWPKNYP